MSALEFGPAILLILVVPAILLVASRFSVWTLSGLVLISLAATRSLFNLAKCRDAGDRLTNRQRLAAAREYFARELRRQNPALDDAWFPYLLAFGLGANVDRWFHSFGGESLSGAPASSPARASTGGGASRSTGGFTGGGGAFGGAGSSGTWAVAAAGIASGVPSPSSSGSGGGGGGGGSSGGGGGGGW
jgi:uncharacterized membrane protein YgcG